MIAGLVLIGSVFFYNGRYLTNQEILDKYKTTFEVTSASRSQTAIINTDYTTALDYYNIHDFSNAALYFSKVLESDPRFISLKTLVKSR